MGIDVIPWPWELGRSKGDRVMSIRINPDGSIETDDVEQAILLSQRLVVARKTASGSEKPVMASEKPVMASETPTDASEQFRGRRRMRRPTIGAANPAPEQQAAVVVTPTTVSTMASTSQVHKSGWEELVGNLGDGPRQVLELLRTRHELTVDQLREITGAKNNQQVTGWVLGLLKNINKFKMNPNDIYRREERRIDGAHTSVYICGSLLRNSGPVVS
jgi:hypothetical protein